MSTFLFVFSLVLTVVFLVGPLWLTIAIANRYNRLEHAVVNYTAMLRAVMAYLERRQWPDLPAPAETKGHRRLLWPFTRLRAFFRRASSSDWLADLNLRDEFEDYLAIIRNGSSERERYMHLKRKNLVMQQGVTRDVEFCRTYTEVLPYMGILGTVLGFFFSPTIFMPGATPTTASIPIGGLVLALSSTAAALICILFVKLVYENRIIPNYLVFEQSLQVIDDYARRYGDLEPGLEGQAVVS
jgi:hypothetical protein